jgi:Holliday junction resolvase RusA-like endonuclease
MYCSGTEGKMISLELQGKPEAQPRPGNSRGGGNKRFNPKNKEMQATKVLLKSVVDTVTSNSGDTLFSADAKLIVECTFFLRRPRTDLKNNRDGRFRLGFPIINLSQLFVKKKIDVDNLSKFTLDCMTGVMYHDDKQVHVLKVAKTYDNKGECEGRTKINIREVKKESELLTF